MVTFVLGPAGSGKTTYITEKILNDLSEGKRVILLVPEQAAVIAEEMLCREAEARQIPQTHLEILNFRRLCNRMFREYGGISYHGISAGGKALLMWEALFSASPLLKRLGYDLEDPKRMVPSLLAAVEECKTYGVTPYALSEAAEEMRGDNDAFADKLSDLSVVFATYQSLMQDTWEDPSDDLTRAADLLTSNRFFSEVSLYLDAFKGFTPEQYRILSYAFRQATSVTVTLTVREDADHLAFETVLREYEMLKDLCPSAPQAVNLSTTHRFRTEALQHLEKHLWAVDGAPSYDATTDDIRTVIATNAYDEAEFVARDIRRRLREEGLRYRDFAVIARDISAYEGILDALFERYDLPCRLSTEQFLREKPIFKLITSAFRVRSNDWELHDVIVYLKTGLTDISYEECDLLEEYASRWNIHGRQFTMAENWYMNPDGYTDRLTDVGRHTLCRVNDIRRRITDPLVKLHESLDGQRTLREICQAIMVFLEELGVPDRIASLGSDDEVRQWNCFSDALDIMAFTLPDRKANAKLFLGLFSLVIDAAQIGTLPATADEIAIGSAGQLRAQCIKHTYLLGVNEGSFPATPSEHGFFSDDEKASLETCGIVLSPKCDLQAISELYIFYLSACTASDSLTLLMSRTGTTGEVLRPSLAFERIRTLFPASRMIDTEDIAFEDRVETRKTALELAFSEDHSAEQTAIRDLLLEEPRYSSYFDANRQPLTVKDEAIGDDVTTALFPGDLALTQSRIDRYVLCAFSYGCQYLLNLKETKRAEFRPSDIGNLVHRILEKFFASVAEDGKIPSLTEKEVHDRIDEILEEYLKGIFGPAIEGELSRRAEQLFLRLRRTVRILIRNLLEEFEQSSFLPRFFEMPISDGGEEASVAPLSIPLPDGTHAYVYGIADRVDICRRGEDIYVRVVDYKTGKKEFSLSDIQLGLNLQMLIYLFSIWKDENGNFRKAVGCTGEIIPAGVLYFKANTGALTADLGTDDAQIYELAAKNLKRNGLLIDDEEVLRLMEAKLSGRYLPVKMAKDGHISKGNSSSTVLASLADMGRLLQEISSTVAKIATEIKSGSFSCHPMKTASHNSCLYCPHKSVCRNPQAYIDQIDGSGEEYHV